jgi:hypothetical protein
MTVEYTDDQGLTHKVDSLDSVPEAFARTIVINGDENASEDDGFEASTEETADSSGLSNHIPPIEVGAPVLIVGVLVFMWFSFKNFLGRILTIGVAILCIAVYVINYGDPSKEKSPISATGNKSSWRDVKTRIDKRETERQKKSIKALTADESPSPE